jgi:glycosyltransferase involved in cell wall biosynthesis
MQPTVCYVGGEDVHMRIPLLLELQKRGFSISALGSESGEMFQEYGIPYGHYPLERWITPIADLRTLAKLFTLLSKHKPDIVHGFDTKPALMAPLVAKRAGVRGRVCTITGLGQLFSTDSLLFSTIRPVYKWVQRWASNASQATVFQNEVDQDYFLSQGIVQPGRQVLVRGSGIDVEGFAAKAPNHIEQVKLRQELGIERKRVVTMVARLVKEKGVKEYLEAANRICQSVSDVVFLLVGPVETEEARAILVDGLRENANTIRYLGQRDDVPALLALSDIFVLPSYYREGIPRVLLEAGAMGLPLITTEMPGCREAVQPGWNGLLVPPRNSFALAAAISQLLSEEENRRQMGVRSRQYIRDHFGLSGVADAYEEIYRNLLANGARERSGWAL